MGRPEDERVKIPALIHLTRLEYDYLSLKTNNYDGDTNIFIDVFRVAISRLNGKDFSEQEIKAIIQEFKLLLDADDLGRSFYYHLLKGFNGITLIDYEHPENNSWNIVTELPCKNGQDEFRPDITVLINGMPLAFIEVKRPNNKDGIRAEYDRMNKRICNRIFRRFINATQLMVFSNNGEYDDNETIPLEGAFYATTGKERLFFSHYREENVEIFNHIKQIDPEKEAFILRDTNLVTIKHTPEYATNISPMTPTHRILSSMFSRDRFLFLLRYGLTYVERTDDNGLKRLEKHIMRYPQIYATHAIQNKLDHGNKHGVIWHTQGSGKTALAYFNVRYLTDYYQKKHTIAKFYFIVDRLDLLKQARDEFQARGLHVTVVDSKEAFITAIGQSGDTSASGELSITVVNIQKFSKDSVTRTSDYNVNVQRVYFMDEAHRSYNPKGSFLSHLLASDRNAVMIALTGTPLIGDGYNTKDVFGAYIHKYYYNSSIKDGYMNLYNINPEYGHVFHLDLQMARAFFSETEHEDKSFGFAGVMKELGYLNEYSGNACAISAKGWQRIEDIQKNNLNKKQGFIAMEFRDETKTIRECFHQAMQNCGYTALAIDEKEHNNQIVPEIFYEIDNSRFLVMDVTYPNCGAYYEAGYALGKGKQVIICCRKDAFENTKEKRPHFDIQQKSMIIWETEAELIERLEKRIKATVK